MTRDTATNEADSEHDKYFSLFDISQNDFMYERELHQHKQYFEYQELLSDNVDSTKGRLKTSLEYWKNIGTNENILNVIENGYVIPFISTPPRTFNKNNKTAIENANFVSEAIESLLLKGCIIEVPIVPRVINPLSVANNTVGKKRLILDLRIVNQYVKENKIKFEDWRVATDLFIKNGYMFKFDISSAYHHVEISSSQQTFLGFSWKNSYYCFRVLPFGLSSAPYLFTKLMRPLVKYWRTCCINIVVYLDDGWGCSSNLDLCRENACFIKSSIEKSGFMLNNDKSIWEPVQKLEWLGLVWNANDYCLNIPDRRIDSVLNTLHVVINKFPFVVAREIAKVTGKVISLSPVVGNVCRLMTRHLHQVILSRYTWDSQFKVVNNHPCIVELCFWKNNIERLNNKKFVGYDMPAVFVYSDASAIERAAYSVQICRSIFYYSWNDDDSTKSSTWRELKAIELAFMSYCKSIQGKTVKWFTDSQNCKKIIESGSMKLELQVMARNIFELCIKNNIRLEVQWIPRSENEQADYLSKMIDFDDWGVSIDFFEFMDDMWGKHTVDRFADIHNSKLCRYNSRFWSPNTEHVDAFSQNWSGEKNWLVPPIYLVNKVVKHIIVCRATGTLVIPKWQSAPFWTMLFEDKYVYKPYVLDVLEFSETKRIFVQGNYNKNSLFGSDKFTGTVLAVRLDARYLNN